MNVVGATSEKLYGWYLKEIHTNATEQNIKIYFNEFAFPSNMQVISAIQNSLHCMNLNNLANEEIVLTNNVLLNKKIKRAIVDVLQPALNKINNKNEKEFMFIKQVTWIYERANEHKFKTDAKIVYFGRLTDDFLLHINLLNHLGYYVLYLCPTKENNIPTSTKTIHLNEHLNNFNFMELMARGEKPNTNVIETSAKKATREIEELLYSGDLVIKPWQYRTGKVNHLHLNAVLEDILTFWNQDARFREGFKIEGDTVSVPSFALELHGVYNDDEKNAEFFKLLTKTELTQLEHTVDFLTPRYTENEMYALAFAMSPNSLSFAQLKKNNLYQLNSATMDVQTFIFNKLNDFYIENNKTYSQVTLLRLIANVITMPLNYLKLIESFDFPFKIPKIVLFIPSRCQLSQDNYLFLKFMNTLGFDVLILSPDGTEVCHDFQDLIVEEFRQDFSLESALNYKKPEKKSFWKRMFD